MNATTRARLLAVFAAALAATIPSGCGSDEAKTGGDKTVAKPGRTKGAGKLPSVAAPALGPVPVEYLSPPPAAAVKPALLIKDLANPVLPKPAVTLTGHSEAANDLAFTPDGKHLITACYGDYSLAVWDSQEGKKLDWAKTSRRVNSVVVTPDGKTVITADSHQNLEFRGFADGKLAPPQRVDAKVGGAPRLAISPNGRLLAAATFEKRVSLWSVAERKSIAEVKTENGMRGIAFSPDGARLAVGSNANTLTVWDLSTGAGKTWTVPQADSKADVGAVAWSPDGRSVLTGHNESTISVIDVTTDVNTHNFYVRDAACMAVAFSPDGGIFLTGQYDNTIHLWEAATASPRGQLKAHTGGIKALALSPDGSTLASSGEDKKIILWR